MARQQDPEHDLDPLLRRVFRPSSLERTDACLDADTVAAWADGTLRFDEVAAVEQHAADCARCRTLLAAVVRSAEASPASGAAPVPAPWWRRWQLPWLVPIAATATALAVYIAAPDLPAPMLPESRSSARVTSSDSPELQRAQSGVDALELPAAAPVEPRALGKATTADANAAANSAQVAAPGGAASRVAAPTASDQPTGGAAALAERIATPSEERAAENTSVGAPAAPKLEAAEADTAGRDSSSRFAPAPPAAAPAPSTGAETLRDSRADVRQRTEPASRRLPLSGGAVAGQWRVTGGALERSMDGRIWATVPLPAGVDAVQLTTGGAAAASAVWLVGRAGLVLVAADADAPLRRAATPTTVDLVSVEARSSRAATVVTADGRRFDTEDGGATWTLGAR